jgi:hypothetical protein
MKEINQRYDFKGLRGMISRPENKLVPAGRPQTQPCGKSRRKFVRNSSL